MPSERAIDAQKSLSSKLVQAVDIMTDIDAEIAPPEGVFGFKATIQTPYVILNNFSEDGTGVGVDFEFEIPFDDDLIGNEATFTIYNLSQNTINKFKIGNTINCTAGYGVDRGIIFEGWISDVKTKIDGVDKITTVYAIDGINYTPQMMNEETYEKGTAASFILRELLERAGLTVEVFKPQRDHIFDNETKVSGSIVENIKLYADICGVSVYINKQKIYCRPIWDGDNLRFNVNASTGMIGSPELFIESNTNEEYTDTVHGYNVTMILQKLITTAGIVNISSKNYAGEYRIVSGTHIYDGLSATTEFKCIEAIFTSIDESKVGGKSDDGEYGETNNVYWEKKDIPTLAAALTSKSMESYTAITATGTLNYKISHSDRATTDSNGLRMYDGVFFIMAMGTYYGPVGTYVKIAFENGKTIYGILGDQKADEHTDKRHMYAVHDNSTLEFQVNPNVISCSASNPDVAKFRQALDNVGIGFDTKLTDIWVSDTAPTFGYTGGGGNSVIEKAVQWAVDIANDDSYYYSWGGWGPYGYDCSHFVITAYEKAGVPVRTEGGASYTGDMYSVFLRYGFEDVTSSVNLSTGAGTKRGDVLLNTVHHAALVYEDGGRIVNASSPASGITTRGWYVYSNGGWDYVLRYTG